MPSNPMENMWESLRQETETNRIAIDRLTKRTEIAGKAFSAPISTEADAPLAADGMNTSAFRFINDVLYYYRADIDAWVPVGEWNYIASDLDIASVVTEFNITSIPSTWDMLKLTLTLRGTLSASSVPTIVQINGDATAGNYGAQRVFLSGATVTAARDTSSATMVYAYVTAATALANAFTTLVIIFANAQDTSKLKTCEYNWDFISTTQTILSQWGHGIFQSTSAINQITVSPDSGNWDAGSGYVLEGKLLR